MPSRRRLRLNRQPRPRPFQKIQPTDAGLNYLRNPRWRFELQEAAFQRGVALAQEKADAAFDLGHDGGQEIKDLQKLLAQRGFYKGAIDGLYGPQTRKGLDLFNQARAAQATKVQGDIEARLAQNETNRQLAAYQLRQRLSVLAEELKASGLDDKSVDAWRRFNPDDLSMEGIQAVQADAEKTVRDTKANAEKLKGGGGGGGFGGYVRRKGLQGLVKAGGIVGAPFEQLVSQPYYAGKRAQLQGASWNEQVTAGVAGLPNLGGLISKKGNLAHLRQAIEDTNSMSERAALTEKGELASFGELLSGRAEKKLKGKSLEMYKRTQGNLGVPALSAPLDAAFNIFADPLNAATLGAATASKPFTLAANAATRSAARRALPLHRRLTSRQIERELGDLLPAVSQEARRAALSTRLGQAVATKLEDVVARTGDVRDLTRKVPGLEAPVAETLIQARAGGRAAIRQAVEDIIATGQWDFTAPLRKQAALSLTRGRVGGSAVTREGTLRFRTGQSLRRLARGDSPDAAATTSSTARQAVRNATEAAATRAGATTSELFDRLVAPKVSGLDVFGRLSRLWEVSAASGNAALRDAIEAEARRLGLGEVSASDLSRLVQDDAFEKALRRLELAAELVSGSDAASRQAAAELAQGLSPSVTGGIHSAERAARNVGLRLPERSASVPYSEAEHRLLKAEISTKIPEGPLRDDLLAELEAVAAKEGNLGPLRRSVDLLRNDPAALEEAMRVSANDVLRREQAQTPAAPARLSLKSAARGPAKVALSMVESVPPPPGTVSFEGTANAALQKILRSEAVDRWAAALGADDFARAMLRQAAEGVRSEDDLYSVVRSGLVRIAKREGVDPQALVDVLEASRTALRNGRATMVDEAGNVIEDLMTLAHRGEDIPLPHPGDVRATIDALKAKAGGPGAAGAKARNAARRLPNTPLGFQTEKGPATIGSVAKGGHRIWKFLVVTNLHLPLVGAAAGFASSDGDLTERAKRAGLGFGIGIFGPVRYLGRVVGLEERLRYHMARTFRAPEWIPVLSKWSRRHGVPASHRFMSADLIRSGADLSGHLRHPLLATVEKGWVALAPKDARFVDGWWRVLNHQLHVEADPVAEFVLLEAAGRATAAATTKAFYKFMGTEDGALWLARVGAGHRGPKDAAEALARYRTFVKTYVPSEDIAAARLSGEVSHEVLKAATKAGNHPAAVHAQVTWRIPRTPKQAAAKRNEIASTFVLEAPTRKVNRTPFAEHSYRDEYLRLRRAGVDAGRAQEIADAYAVRRTNEVMFNVNDESRFAKAVDFVFPFQQPREELFRVWAKLVAKSPARSAKMGRLAALALNNGQDEGIFRRDPISGEYVFAVPGTAWLNEHLFGTNANFVAELRGLLFFGQGAYNVNFIPSPGGPYWTVLSRSFLNSRYGQEWMEEQGEDGVLKNLLFPYGSTGNLFRNEARRLWMGMTGSVAPWEFASKFEQENELNRWEVEVFKHLVAEHRRRNPNDLTWQPSDETVKKEMRSLMKAWAFVGAAFPSTPRPYFVGRDEAQLVREMYTSGPTGKFDYRAAVEANPHLEPYFKGATKYVGPDDWKHWSRDVDEAANDWLLHRKQYKSLDEFSREMTEAQHRAKAWGEFYERITIQNSIEKERALMEWREKYPDIAEDSRSDYLRDLELANILRTYPLGHRDEALDDWRRRWAASPAEYRASRRKIETGQFEFNPWRLARDSEDVVADVEKLLKRGFSEEVAVGVLSPAEQVRYWNGRLVALIGRSADADPSALMDEWWKAKAARNTVFKANPWLGTKKPATTWDSFLAKWRGDYRAAIAGAWAEAGRLKQAMQVAKDAKDWKALGALREKRNASIALARDLQNRQYRSLPEAAELQDELRAHFVFANGGRAQQAALKGFLDGEFIPSNEEQTFLKLPERMREAYVDDLAKALDREPFTDGKLFWDWLSDFQRDLLESNLPEEMVSAWRRQSPDEGGAGGRGRKGRSFGGLAIGEGGGEIAFAIEMFKQFTQRPAGAKPPAAYAEYLKLPNNPAVRADFLKRHPNVRNWVKSGPFANMPPVVRLIVANIMVKYGRWEGEEREYADIAELAFAQEQLRRWSRRENVARPEAYDIWLQLPSGPEKAAYLKAHPEVENWIRLGPMANMPDEYRDVVRDIMLRYGEWTQQQDPLGSLIAEYYTVPAHGRDAFLAAHPELVEYWNLLRSPEEQRLYRLSDQYFAIQDVGARRMFLSAHPELQEFFVKQRTKRYERFMNRVAQFMGANPTMFEHYLQRQGDILAELLNKFAEPVLVREVRPMSESGFQRASVGESGRQRRAA